MESSVGVHGHVAKLTESAGFETCRGVRWNFATKGWNCKGGCARVCVPSRDCFNTVYCYCFYIKLYLLFYCCKSPKAQFFWDWAIHKFNYLTNTCVYMQYMCVYMYVCVYMDAYEEKHTDSEESIPKHCRTREQRRKTPLQPCTVKKDCLWRKKDFTSKSSSKFCNSNCTSVKPISEMQKNYKKKRMHTNLARHNMPLFYNLILRENERMRAEKLVSATIKHLLGSQDPKDFYMTSTKSLLIVDSHMKPRTATLRTLLHPFFMKWVKR